MVGWTGCAPLLLLAEVNSRVLGRRGAILMERERQSLEYFPIECVSGTDTIKTAFDSGFLARDSTVQLYSQWKIVAT